MTVRHPSTAVLVGREEEGDRSHPDKRGNSLTVPCLPATFVIDVVKKVEIGTA